MDMDVIEKLLGGRSERRHTLANILPEAAIERLKETAARIHAGNPFKVGDIVTVREDSPMKSAGIPHLIIGIDPVGYSRGSPADGQWGTAITYDVSFIWTDGDHVIPHVAPHWMLEPYTTN